MHVIIRKIESMIKPGQMLPIIASLLLCHSALAKPTASLHGIVHVPGYDLALVRIDKDSWSLKKGDRFEVESREKLPAEVLELDLTNEILITSIGDRNYTNSLPTPNRPPANRSWIHLRDADFMAAMELYAHLSGRTILLHPLVATNPFSCEASWTDERPTTNTITACFVTALNQRGAAALEDGDHFLQILPASMAQSASLGSKVLPKSAEPDIDAGLVDFHGVQMSQVIDIYGSLIGRQRKDTTSPCDSCIPIYFQTTCPLSKPEIAYAFETLFRWNRAKITLHDDNTFSVIPLSESER